MAGDGAAGRKLPLSLSMILQVVVPVSVCVLLAGGLFLKHWHDERLAEERAQAARRVVTGQVSQMNALLAQLQTQMGHLVDLQTTLQGLPPDDPRRPALEQQIGEAKARIEATQKALAQTTYGGAPLPGGPCDCKGDPYCDCTH